MSGISFLFLPSLPFQPHRKTVFLKSASTPRFSVFQAFRTPTSAASPAWKLLKLFHSCSSFGSLFQYQFLRRAFLDPPLEVILCFISLQYSVLFSPDSAVVYIILIFFTISPQRLLQILHTVGPQEAHLTGTRLRIC